MPSSGMQIYIKTEESYAIYITYIKYKIFLKLKNISSKNITDFQNKIMRARSSMSQYELEIQSPRYFCSK